jgi:hypothetical protein
MKVKFSKRVTFKPKWNGNLELPEAEQFKVQLSVLQFGDLQSIIDAYPKNDDAQDKRLRDFSKLTLEYVPRYATIEGLNDDDGEVTAEVVAKYPTYTSLASEILSELVAVSSPKGNDEKN